MRSDRDVELQPTQPQAATGATRTSEPAPAAARTAEPTSRGAATPSTPLRDPARYEILGEHGRGGLGRVSRAHDRELGRDVAIKELIARGNVDEVRFLREALITARLEHPGIVPVHEAGRWPDGTPFYAMKLVSGRSLRELIAERKTVDERLGLLHHVIAVADAIAYAHGRNIIHRDLKPANVIVGDFGETIVIDWGLAKDLTASDEAVTSGSHARIARDDDLTETGSVLGTPAYMAPEQERGESVDQRADVFAIGGMLWELCTIQKLPPPDSELRRELLRSAGIDTDLATIIDKALARDRAQRYPDAGALAADLKAFKSGARIAARSYSLFAMLGHWIRRHRALAISVASAAVLAIAGVAAYVRNTAIERDRAEAANNGLTLEHAELLLHSDPTAAVAALAGYHGGDRVRRGRLLAEARGRGVARTIVSPHNDSIRFLFGDASGGVISLGEDRRIQWSHGASATTLASDVAQSVQTAYSAPAGLLAYATTPTGVAVLDLRTRTTLRICAIQPLDMDISADGRRLAVLDDHGELTVWSIGPRPELVYRAAMPGAWSVRFTTPERVIVALASGLRGIALDGTLRIAESSETPKLESLTASPDAVAIGSSTGTVAVFSLGLAPVASGAVCQSQIHYLHFIPRSDRIAFACQEGVAGVVQIDPRAHGLRTIDKLITHGSTKVYPPDPTGRYIALIDESHTAQLYDTESRVATHYDGNAGYPTYVTAPTAEFNHVMVGDANGTVRVWEPPSPAVRIVAHARDALLGVAFSPDGKTLVAYGLDPVILRIALGDRATAELAGHTAGVLTAEFSPEGGSLLSYGWDHTVRIWRTGDAALLRTFADHAGALAEAAFIESGRRVVSAGGDGRLLAWSPTGSDVTTLFATKRPLAALEVLARNGHIVVVDVDGAIWDVAPDREARQIRKADGVSLTVMRASRDGRFLATGSDAGQIAIYDTNDWQVVRTLSIEGSVRQIRFDPKNRDVVIASEPGRSPFGHILLAGLDGRRSAPWRDVPASARDIQYTPDGETIAVVCTGGGIWLYAMRSDTWAYTQDHDTDVFVVAFSPDGKLLASGDRRGYLVVRDVQSTLAELTGR